jgi:hypothetical protein
MNPTGPGCGLFGLALAAIVAIVVIAITRTVAATPDRLTFGPPQGLAGCVER